MNTEDVKEECEGGDVEEELPIMPSKRLEDIIQLLISGKNPKVINLDASLKSTEMDIMTIILERLPSSVTTLSLRFNNLGHHGAEILTEWLKTNETLQVLYLMGTGIDSKARDAIDLAWKKKLKGHRTENHGYTLIRVDPNSTPIEPFPA